MADIRINQLPLATGPTSPMQSDFVPIDGTNTRKATLLSLADVINPPASQAEAEAGTDAVKRMTPLTVKQSISVNAASLAQGALADSSLQPSDIGTGSGSVAAGDDSRIVGAAQKTQENVFTKAQTIAGPFALKDLGASTPASGVYMAPGNSLSFQNLLSNPVGGFDTDNQRASVLIVGKTTDDGNSQEQTLNILTVIETGFFKTWTVSTAYALGDNIAFPAANTVYRCIQAGTSAPSGTGPTGKGTNIVDGTARWQWINDSAVNAKVGVYEEVQMKAGGGAGWGSARNVMLSSGYAGPFAANTEFDMSNFSGIDATIGGANLYNLYVQNNGPNRLTSALEIGSHNSSNFAGFWGIHLTGNKLAERASISVDHSGAIGLGFGATGGGVNATTYTDSVIKDGSTSPIGIFLAGSYASGAIFVTGATATSYASTGTKTLASFYDGATTPVGVSLSGTYSTFQIAGSGWGVKPNGRVDGNGFKSSAAAPATSTSAGEQGEIRVDANFIYVCTSTNVWKRAALSAF